MRAVIFSDSHGNLDVLEEIVEKYRGKADFFMHLGDGEREVEYLRYLYPDEKIYFVSGNCDFSSEEADFAVLETGGKRIFYTHGHRFGIKSGLDLAIEEAKRNSCDVLLYGHSHVPYVSFEEGVWIMNPGSVSRPRNPEELRYSDIVPKRTYGILEIENGEIRLCTIEID